MVEPFYDFKGNRLARFHDNPFSSYLDPYGRADGNGNPRDPASRPYAYFSAGKAGNDYSRYGPTDCPRLGVAPYLRQLSPPIFHNRSGFQIICAGPDRPFGPGGRWSPAAAGGTPAAGRDDVANFHEARLGSGQ